MESNFFNEAKKREQGKRHFNLVFSQYFIKYVDNPFINDYMQKKGREGYESAALFLENKLIREDEIIHYFYYLQKRFNVERATLIEILGMKDATPELKTPGGYNQEQDFILLIHLVIVSAYDGGFNNSQNEFYNGLRKTLNYDAEKANYLSSLVSKYLEKYSQFVDFPKLENNIKTDFLLRFNSFPPLSHG